MQRLRCRDDGNTPRPRHGRSSRDRVRRARRRPGRRRPRAEHRREPLLRRMRHRERGAALDRGNRASLRGQAPLTDGDPRAFERRPGSSRTSGHRGSLPHDLERGGLRRLAGLTYAEIRQSSFSDMFGLFDDDPRLGPSLQAQLFLLRGSARSARSGSALVARRSAPVPSRCRLRLPRARQLACDVDGDAAGAGRRNREGDRQARVSPVRDARHSRPSPDLGDAQPELQPEQGAAQSSPARSARRNGRSPPRAASAARLQRRVRQRSDEPERHRAAAARELSGLRTTHKLPC